MLVDDNKGNKSEAQCETLFGVIKRGGHTVNCDTLQKLRTEGDPGSLISINERIDCFQEDIFQKGKMIDSTLDVAKHMDDGDGNGINIPSIGNNKPCGTHKRGYSTNAYCDQDHNKYPNCAFDGHKHVTSDQVGLGFSDAMMGAAPGDDFNEDVAVPSN